MNSIHHNLMINALAEEVFSMVSTSDGLNQWWSKDSIGEIAEGKEFDLVFEEDYKWKAKVSRYIKNQEVEFTIVDADKDWLDTRVNIVLTPINDYSTQLRFVHMGWEQKNEHYKISCYCWAMYLRILKRYLEFEEEVEYRLRLEI